MIKPLVDHVNFNQIVAEMKQAGAFADYTQPLGQGKGNLIAGTRNPKYPGERAYQSAVTVIAEKKDIPQFVVDSSRKSVVDAINLYMPGKYFLAWMHEYFSGKFLESPEYKRLVSSTPLPRKYIDDDRLDDSLTMDFVSPKRKIKAQERLLFTNREHGITEEIYKEHPELVMTVIAYQASFVEYLKKLRGAIRSSLELNEDEKKRGNEVATELISNWSAMNFAHFLIPTIAMQHRKDFPFNKSNPLTQSNFVEGTSFAMRNNLFNRAVTTPSGSEINVTCPASVIINRTSMAQLERDETQSDATKTQTGFGIALFHIYREVQKHVALSPALKNEVSAKISRDSQKTL